MRGAIIKIRNDHIESIEFWVWFITFFLIEPKWNDKIQHIKKEIENSRDEYIVP